MTMPPLIELPIKLPTGQTIEMSELLLPPKPDQSVTYCTDTSYCHNSVTLAQETSVLIHECTFTEEHHDKAAGFGHSTARMAAQVAIDARVKHVIMTHFSGRHNQSRSHMRQLEKEAALTLAECPPHRVPSLSMATDFDVFTLDAQQQLACTHQALI
jgi:ribonuclease Z